MKDEAMTATPIEEGRIQDVLAAIDERQAGRHTGRRRFLAYAGGAAALGGGLSLLGGCGKDGTSNAVPTPTPTPTASSTSAIRDIDIMNFALNLEYLEANYYSYAAYGTAPNATLTGVGTQGVATGGLKVAFTDNLVASYARELASDQAAHITVIKSILGGASVAMPAINIDGLNATTGAFALAAQAANIANADGTFNPYASDENFLLGAFLLEDVGVTAYKGASPLLTDTTFIDVAAGLLATEAYHAGLIRSVLYRRGIESNGALFARVQALSDARDSLDGTSDLDQGIGVAGTANITPTDTSGIAYSRSTGQVLNIAYLSKAQVSKGGFFPNGINGNIKASAASG